MYAISMTWSGAVILSAALMGVAPSQVASPLQEDRGSRLTGGQLAQGQTKSPGASAAPVQHDHQRLHAVMERGAAVMGFDQHAATHHFILTRDGGRIEITANDPSDQETARQVATHLRQIAAQFREGHFGAPRAIHNQDPPGVDVLKRLNAQVSYKVASLPGGGVLRISSASEEVSEALHAFLRYQIREHGTGDPLYITREKS